MLRNCGAPAGGVLLVRRALWLIPLLCGCSHDPRPQQDDPITKVLMDGAAPNVGKTLWISESFVGMKVCPGPAMSSCEYRKSGKFKVEAVEIEQLPRGDGTMIAMNSPVYRVAFADGQRGYISTIDLIGKTSDKDPQQAKAECKRRGDPRVGMTVDQVTATCWGKPEHVNRTQTATHISDQYVYSNSRYVYLQNGIVTSVQMSGTLQ